jgi:hypothetical protein
MARAVSAPARSQPPGWDGNLRTERHPASIHSGAIEGSDDVQADLGDPNQDRAFLVNAVPAQLNEKSVTENSNSSEDEPGSDAGSVGHADAIQDAPRVAVPPRAQQRDDWGVTVVKHQHSSGLAVSDADPRPGH